MDNYIQGAEQKMQDGIDKANNLGENLKEMEKRLRKQRINDCEDQIGATFDALDKLQKILEKLDTQMSIIHKD